MAHHSAPAGAPLSRRRILQGVAWATPAVVIAAGAPAAAAGSVDPGPPPDAPFAPAVTVTYNRAAAMDVADLSVTLRVPSTAPAGSFFGPGSSVTVNVPRGNQATVQVMTYDASLWTATPANLPANQTGSVTFVYKGPAIVAPSSTQLNLAVRFSNGFNHNSTQTKHWTATTTVMDASGAELTTVNTVVPPPSQR